MAEVWISPQTETPTLPSLGKLCQCSATLTAEKLPQRIFFKILKDYTSEVLLSLIFTQSHPRGHGMRALLQGTAAWALHCPQAPSCPHNQPALHSPYQKLRALWTSWACHSRAPHATAPLEQAHMQLTTAGNPRLPIIWKYFLRCKFPLLFIKGEEHSPQVQPLSRSCSTCSRAVVRPYRKPKTSICSILAWDPSWM